MEQEHMIIIALLVVALYFLMMRKPCACPRVGQGFGLEKFRFRDAAQNAEINATPMGLPDARQLRIRTEGSGGQGFLQHVQNRNHNMYQSQHVKHHLKADHRGKMMRNMMGRSDCALYPQDC